MSHQPGWIDLYTVLENGDVPENDLVRKCKLTRTGLGETMLHWYSIEGSSQVLGRLIELGFEVNVQNEFGSTPVMECASIERWDNVRVLIENFADLSIKNNSDEDFYEYMEENDVDIPSWVPART